MINSRSTRTCAAVANGALVPGAATTVKVMVKDARAYPATGSRGFGRVIDGQPADAARDRAGFACHAASVKDRDHVSTRFAK